MTLFVYGIPKCGTCKKAMEWLENNGVSYEFINIKENPPSEEIIEKWAEVLGVKSMRNTSGMSYRALGEKKNSWTDADWIKAFAEDAMLLKRPLFVKDNQAVLVGFRANEAVKKEKLCN